MAVPFQQTQEFLNRFCNQSCFSCFSPTSESLRNDPQPSWPDTSGIAQSKSSLLHTFQVELVLTQQKPN